jgi:hypothetical protein
LGKNITARKELDCTLNMMKATGLDPEHKLIGDLMKNYDQNARPILDKTKPVNVRFDLAVNQIVELVNILSIPIRREIILGGNQP